MARSSNNTRVNANVQPQVRAHTSILKGSDVIVMDGPSRGLIGMCNLSSFNLFVYAHVIK